MAKYKNEKEQDCVHMLCQLGKGLPLCSYKITKEQRLAEARPQDFPPCNKKKCPMLAGREPSQPDGAKGGKSHE